MPIPIAVSRKPTEYCCENCGREDDVEEYRIDLPRAIQTFHTHHLADLCSICTFNLGMRLVGIASGREG